MGNFFLVCLMAFLCIPEVRSSAFTPVPIRVRIAQEVPVVLVRAIDLRITPENASAENVAKTVSQKSDWEFRCAEGKIRGVQKSPEIQMKEWRGTLILRSESGFLTANGGLYRDELRIYTTGSGCDVVNHLDMEKYLEGLVNTEFSSKWSSEATAAQVVAARSYALYQIRVARKKRGSHFDLDGTTKDQVYQGFLKEDSRASRIVEKTRGLVLTTRAGSDRVPIKAFYHSTCGGLTERPERVWGQPMPGLSHSVVCSYCGASPRFRWKLDLKQTELEEILRKQLVAEGVPEDWPTLIPAYLRQGHLEDLRVSIREQGGRISRIIITWENDGKRWELPLSGARFRDWVGNERVRSTFFDLTYHLAPEGAMWQLQGKGNGHGVGMCQWGAKGMGEKGYSMQTILKHYYPGAEIARLW